MKTFYMAQYSSSWWQIRAGVPTASAFDRILTPTGKISGQQVKYIAELIGDRTCLDPNFFSDRPMTRAMEAGRNTEPEARRYYEYTREKRIQQVGFCVTDDWRFGCSPDGLVDGDGVLELKCPLNKTQAEYLMDGGLPAEYKPQVHGHLLVTGRPWVDFLSYAPPLPPLLVRVERDAYTDTLRAALDAFHELYVAKVKYLALDVAEFFKPKSVATDPATGEISDVA